MREIKFRQWYGDRFYYWGFNAKGDGSYFTGPTSGGNIRPQDCVHEQFTGLLDRNGVEIYEGDIIHYMPDLFDSIHVVEPSLRTTARMIIKKRSYWPPQYLDAMQSVDVEVIGNIHQNPELLEGKA